MAESWRAGGGAAACGQGRAPLFAKTAGPRHSESVSWAAATQSRADQTKRSSSVGSGGGGGGGWMDGWREGWRAMRGWIRHVVDVGADGPTATSAWACTATRHNTMGAWAVQPRARVPVMAAPRAAPNQYGNRLVPVWKFKSAILATLPNTFARRPVPCRRAFLQRAKGRGPRRRRPARLGFRLVEGLPVVSAADDASASPIAKNLRVRISTR